MAGRSTVLVVRPAADAEALARRLTPMGIDAIISPVMTIKASGPSEIAVDGAQALLITSVQAVRTGLSRLSGDRRALPPLWAVGDATAEAAKAAGMADVRAGPGDAAGLAQALTAYLDPADGPLLYLAGRTRKPDLEAALQAAGFAVDTVPVYDAVPAATLSPEALAALGRGRVDAVLLYSARTARLLGDLAHRCDVAAGLTRASAVCLSPAVAEAAAAIGARTVVAPRPDTAALLSALGDALGLDVSTHREQGEP